MKNHPKISVVMSVYNGELYLGEAIESILNQTYKNFEFIIINDGSTDNSLEIIEQYKKTDPRIVLISRENKGLIASLNEGIAVAKGEYIARMDADDISLPDRFAEQVKVMDSDKELVVCGSWINVIGGKYKNKTTKYYEKDKDIKAQLLLLSCFAHPSVMIRSEIIAKHGIQYVESAKHAEDYMLWMELARVGKFYNIPKRLLTYRYLETSITRIADKHEEERKKIHLTIYQKGFELIKLVGTTDELEILFNLSTKERIKTKIINHKDLTKLFKKLLQGNNATGFACNRTLKLVLGKRWLLSTILRKDIRFLFSKYFIYGLIERLFY